MKSILLIFYLCFSPVSSAFQPVDINIADAEQIALLPGVGEKLALRIVAYRKKQGALKGPEDFLSAFSLSEKKFAQIKDRIVFGAMTKTKNHQRLPPAPPKITLPQKSIIDLLSLEALVLRAHGLATDIEASLEKRVRRAAFLPKLSTYVDLDRGEMLSEKLNNNVRDSTLMRGGRDVGFGIRAIFDLDKLIFNSDELEVQKLHLRRLEKREELIARLHKNYFKYLRLYDSAQQPIDISLAQQISKELSELELVLDSLSHGEFSNFQTRHMKNEPGEA